MTIQNKEFFEKTTERFSEVLGKLKFDFVEVVESGFFGNCELIYKAGNKVISIQREKGSLRVYYGFEVDEQVHVWLLDLLVRALFEDSRCSHEETEGLLTVNDEFHEFNLEYKRYVKLIDNYIEEINLNFFSGNLLESKETLDEFSQKLSNEFIDNLVKKPT